MSTMSPHHDVADLADTLSVGAASTTSVDFVSSSSRRWKQNRPPAAGTRV